MLRVIDDEKSLGFSAANYAVSEGGGFATITVELTGESLGTTITVNYATSSGTATAGLDFTSGSNTLIFPPGGTPTGIRTKTFTVPILQDTLAEGLETLTLTLGAPTPLGVAQLVTARATAILSIDDDDQGGKIEFDAPVATPVQTFTALEGAGVATIRVKRTPDGPGALASGVTVAYATSDRTATAGLDYVATAGRLTFGAGVSSLTFAVPLINDALGEGIETVNLALLNPGGGGALGSAATAVLDIQDDEPHVKFSATTYAASEGAGFLTVTVDRGGVDTATLTVEYATADQFPAGAGKAVAGVDYTAVTGTLTFPPGVRSRTFTVPLLNDSVPEPDEKLDVLLRNATISSGTVTIVAPARAEVNITDDDLGGTIQLSSATYTVNEDGGDAVVTVTRSGGQAGSVSVRLQTGDLFAVTPPRDPQTASAPADYTSTDVRVTFGPTETTKTVRIPIATDAAAEGVETLYVQLSDPQPGGTPGAPSVGQQSLATISIVDAQPTVQFSRATFTATEGQPVATVTVERTAPFGRLLVDWATSDGTALAPTNYLSASGSLTFDPGVTSQSFTVRLVDNQAVELDKTFQVTLSNLQPGGAATLGPRTTADVLIKDNDRGGAFTVSGGSVIETNGNTTTTVTVSRTGGSGGPVSVRFHARTCGIAGPGCDFPAQEGVDFDAISNVLLTFLPGEMSKTMTIVVHGDTVPVGSRDIQVSISNPLPSVLQDTLQIGPELGTSDALVRIVEDNLYFVFLSADSYGAQENAREGFVTVVRSGLPAFLASSVTLDMIAIPGGSNPAVPGLDYVDLGGGIAARDTAFTFAPNQTTKTFRIPFLDDDLVDGAKSFIVFINSATPANTDSPRGPAIAFPGSALLTVNDEDIGGAIELSADVFSVTEDVASGTATITLTRTGGLAAGVSVLAQTGDNFAATTPPQTATAGSDYVSTSTFVTFNVGDTVASFTVPIINDGVADGVKTVNLKISSPQPVGVGAAPTLGTRQTAILRIVDANQTVGFALANFDASEAAGTATIQVERTGDVSGLLTVNYATSDGTALAGVHYQTATGTLTFGANQTIATFTVPMIDNKVVATDKVVNLTLSSPSAGTALAPATLTIKDDDRAGAIGFRSANYVVSESGGQAEIVIVRSGGTAGCPSPLVGPAPSCPDATLVTFSTSDGTASAAGGDYTATTTVVEFGAGEFTKTILVPITADFVVEGTETVNLSLTTPLPSGLTGSPTLGTIGTAALQIVEAQFRIGVTAPVVGEGGGQATITIVREGDLSGTSTIDYVTMDGTATGPDYVPVAGGQLTFTPGMSVLTFDVAIAEDGFVEGDERFDLVFTNPVGGTIARESCATATPAAPAQVANCTVTVAVLDNDAGGVLSFSQAVYDVNENAGTATITVRRLGGSAGNVTVDFATSDGTAAAGVDYGATTQTLAFGLGESVKTVSVPVLGGTLGVRTAALRLRNATGGATIGTPSSAALRISDLNNSVGFAFVGFAVNESVGSAAVTLRRTGTSGVVTVQLATSDGSAVAGSDYASVNTIVTFAAGATTATVMVPITSDAIVEGNETLTLTLSNPTNASIATDSCLVGTPIACTASVTILDDDQGGVIEFTGASYTVAENAGNVLVTLSRTGGLAGGVSVTFGATTGTAAPLDFNVPSTTVNFGPGQSTATALVNIVDNFIADADRTINLALSAPQPSGQSGSPILGLRTTAVLTIVDNEPRVRFASPTFSVTEGAPVAMINVMRSGDPSVEVRVDVATADGTATAPADYTAVGTPLPVTLTFLPGILSQSFAVPITNDGILESPETVTLTLSNERTNPPQANRVAVGGTNPAVLTILDNDRAGTLAFNASTYTVSEPGGTLRVFVTRTGGSAGGVTVNYQAVNGTAVNGTDYVPVTAGTLTFGSNETARPVDITIVDNGAAQGPRTFTLQLSNPTPPGAATLGPPSQAVVTIGDDEQTVRFASPGYSSLENKGPAKVVVERLGTATGTLLVDFATAGGTAIAPADYTAVVRTLTFGAGVRTLTVPVTIVNDTRVEGNETIDLQLSNPRFLVPGPPLAIASGNCVTFIGRRLHGATHHRRRRPGRRDPVQDRDLPGDRGHPERDRHAGPDRRSGRSRHGGLRHQRRHGDGDGRSRLHLHGADGDLPAECHPADGPRPGRQRHAGRAGRDGGHAAQQPGRRRGAGRAGYRGAHDHGQRRGRRHPVQPARLHGQRVGRHGQHRRHARGWCRQRRHRGLHHGQRARSHRRRRRHRLHGDHDHPHVRGRGAEPDRQRGPRRQRRDRGGHQVRHPAAEQSGRRRHAGSARQRGAQGRRR